MNINSGWITVFAFSLNIDQTKHKLPLKKTWSDCCACDCEFVIVEWYLSAAKETFKIKK